MALYTYPSNKLEYLVEVFAKLLEFNQERKAIFDQNNVLVGSRGMQHWLSMELASKSSITMNFNFDMINSFIVNTCSKIAKIEETKKAYTKEILTWRIYAIISSKEFIADSDNSSLNDYWISDGEINQLKCYQLSNKISEIFSKYIKFRPDWLEKWQLGESIDKTQTVDDESWQMKLWQKLVAQESSTPMEVQAKALEKLGAYATNLPKDLYIFGINAISPQNLNFIFELSEYINIHILYIDPCSQYWYDICKDKVSVWLGNDDFELQPLLANLGQQGKEFFSQILENDTKHEVTVYGDFKSSLEVTVNSEESISTDSMLSSIQQNLLELNTKKMHDKDSSISIHSCHSPMREVQVLHDRLLDMFATDPDLKPKEILVMCPNIEDYAPYISSIFTKNYDENRIPCSIADRTLKDSEPLISSFIDLLQLPDSSFEVTKILEFLSVPAIQRKFVIENSDIETIEYWLREACVHRNLGNTNKTYSWQWGLNRLLLGFCISDKHEIVNDNTLMTVPSIKGKEIAELGAVYELLELLNDFAEDLKEPRTVEQWQELFVKNIKLLFEVSDDDSKAKRYIENAIVKLVESTKQAGVTANQKLDLTIVRYYLSTLFSEPEINNHFLTGKVTFCSMTPMRSIPFKVVAMLGLNSGQFPRQENSINFDIMAQKSRQKGDTTTKDNDRYLFLESIISARQSLYLSYIGNSVKNNAEQQASLVLKELINYMQKNYGFEEKDIYHYPLHPFSEKCYKKGDYQSYDKNWLKLLKKKNIDFYNQQSIGESTQHRATLDKNLTIREIVKIFDDPLKAFCSSSLHLYFSQTEDELSDSEPFDVNNLVKHQFKGDTVSALLDNQSLEDIKLRTQLSGVMPQSPLTESTIIEETEKLQRMVDNNLLVECTKKPIVATVGEYHLSANISVDKEDNIKVYGVSKGAKPKDRLSLYLSVLIKAINDRKAIEKAEMYFNSEKQSSVLISLKQKISPEQAEKELLTYLKLAEQLLNTPKLSHLKLADVVYNAKDENNKSKEWKKVVEASEHNFDSLEENPYFAMFYPDNPSCNEFDSLDDLYSGLFEAVE
ncbi:exodeoxyribonuclease V subunit gamma [Francisella adeliensis]|uniref:RecBCD enzyme subunit RecC n=1 Tax=Francisella adeliensis TaxID=2007306 RepID=A0A2Z4Y0A0_9GAMM|nr:exodeoxyribonuclease V subunit gamma [Francisella adeliensis]AXA34328.1 exodeoxyribonuclease V subunit gamma [Francisella adeliensis]MBK2084684.1 exodeoxyribonuclease V subunit gamma [Francisella adeliensis]MBK2096193.1 exodeoxyribonuclease V subunit gamma [Francisella adeliensis]QIW12575.1 exodeoxyribonuclease V subunit gamma [Francisella adeliensis]QIW14448.1 exodeoxyribonuclease V subunit gamma [Francisella adeliensis]